MISHLEDTSEPILCQIADLQDLELGWTCSHVKLLDNNLVNDDGRDWSLV